MKKTKMGKAGGKGSAAYSPRRGEPGFQSGGDLRRHIEKFGWFREKLVPSEKPGEGRQYAFHFDATKCIGCKCCVVACKEQNNNPAAITWRKVGEIEADEYPRTKRLYLSMGCNHCLEPACMAGCPTDSYTKDPSSGIVLHNDDTCVGCQYCIWNCPYGAPRYNPRRRIVTKCDMCYPRLTHGQIPACVDSCPQGAIQIEERDKNEWRNHHEGADSPGIPDSSQTLSTTKITLPEGFRKKGRRVNAYKSDPEHSHASLIWLLVLSQLSVGAFLIFQFFKIFQGAKNTSQGHAGLIALDRLLSLSVFSIAALSLGIAVFHLGRPLFIYRPVKMWKKSWLSREALFLGLFTLSSFLYAFALYLSSEAIFYYTPELLHAVGAVGALAAIMGVAGIYSSAKLYILPSRPAWNTPITVIQFFLTSILLGSLFFLSILSLDFFSQEITQIDIGSSQFLRGVLYLVIAVALAKTSVQLLSFLSVFTDEGREKYSTLHLLIHKYRNSFLMKNILFFLGGVVLPIAAMDNLAPGGSPNFWYGWAGSFAAVLAAELIEKYHFFVTVVPKNTAGNFFDS